MFLMRFLIFLIVLAWPAVGFSQNWVTPETCASSDFSIPEDVYPPDWFAVQEARYANGVGRLWQVTAPNGAVSHIWGSMHLNHKSVLTLPETFKDIVLSSKVVLPEIDTRFGSRAAVVAYYAGHGFWATDALPSPHDYLDGDLRDWIEARLLGLGYPEASLDYITLSGLVAIMISNACNDFNPGALMQDYWIVQNAEVAGAEIVGLEARDAVMEDLSQSFNRAQAIAILKLYASYLDPDYYDTSGQNVYIGMYQKGHIAGLMGADIAFAQEQFGEVEGTKIVTRSDDYLLRFRNARFLETAIPYLEDGGALMVVGAFHLPGELGLVEMLRAAGYGVDRIPVEGEIGFE